MKRFLSELIGTFALVFAGTGAIVVNDVRDGVITHLGVSIVFGLVVMVMIYAVGEISGAHFNPAVTIGFAISRRFPWSDVPAYIAAQLAGALLASGLVGWLLPPHDTLGATLPSLALPQAFVMEVILTFLLMFVIINVAIGAKEKGITAGLAIGFTVMLCALFAGPLTGASMNPARSLAPALVSGATMSLWLYLLAPPLGAALAVWCWQLINPQSLKSSGLDPAD